jgi:hypothetical protein
VSAIKVRTPPPPWWRADPASHRHDRKDSYRTGDLNPDFQSAFSFLILIARLSSLKTLLVYSAAHRGASRAAARLWFMIFSAVALLSSCLLLGRRMVWSCRCSRGPGRMFPSSQRRWRVRRPGRGTWRCGSAMSWARCTPCPVRGRVRGAGPAGDLARPADDGQCPAVF